MNAFEIDTTIDAAQDAGEAGSGWAGFIRSVWEVTKTLVFVTVMIVGINLVTQRVRVTGNSMVPTFHNGEIAVVNRLAYRSVDIHRGDVIVFFRPDRADAAHSELIKRVIGLPGELVEIRSGRVFVDGSPLAEAYIQEPALEDGRWAVPLGHVFVMGDNRNGSQDSRFWGPLPIQNIVGKVWVIYWPIERFRVVRAAGYLEPSNALAH